MDRNPQNINPRDVFPLSNLPDEGKPWGRAVMDRIIALESAVLGQRGSVQGINRNIAATTANLSDQLLQLRTNYPVGAIIMYSSTTAPHGWLVCDGSAVSRTDYADLFALIGTTYGGGDGSTTFNLPNLKGRVVAGHDPSQTEFNTVGKTGGAKTHTLTIAEMPSHTHTFSGDSHRHSNSAVSMSSNSGSSTNLSRTGNGSLAVSWFTDYATVSGSNSSEGGGQAHNNLQPYIALPYIIKHTAA